MKYLPLLLSLILCSGCSQWKKFSTGSGVGPANDGPVNILVFGQSNGVSDSAGYPVVTSVSGHVHVTDYWCDTGPTPCSEGMKMATPGPNLIVKSNQAWQLMGDMLYGALGHDVYFYNTCHGGYSTQQLIDGGELDNTLRVLRQHPEIHTLIYVQGESERGLTMDKSYQNLKYMIESTKSVNPNLQWVMNLNWFGRPAQERIISEGFALRGPDLDIFRQTYLETDFKGPSIKPFADLWYSCLMALRPWN